ncbi:MAG: DUF4419 domain-containing protein [Polyangiaceae bacterium]
MSKTFEISTATRAVVPLQPVEATSDLSALVLHGWPVEAWGSNPPRRVQPPLRSPTHGLVAAVGTAFGLHYPLVLTPDSIWLAIAQGAAAHVKQNAERLQGKLVRDQAGTTLHVRRDDFVKGSPENPWPDLFASFSEQISVHLGRQRDLFICNFSTTGPCERAASEIVLIDAMQAYFRYSMGSMCGIPAITLEGTKDDYVSIRRRVRALEEYDLSWWTESLLPVIDQFIAAFDGQIDVSFWRSIFKLNDNSGHPFITGWINALFPYLQDIYSGAFVENRYSYRPLTFKGKPDPITGAFSYMGELAARFPIDEEETLDEKALEEAVDAIAKEYGDDYEDGRPRGPREDCIPCGLSVAPFVWSHLGTEYQMELLGGFVGIAQDEGTLALRPAIGWAVREARSPEGGMVPPWHRIQGAVP